MNGCFWKPCLFKFNWTISRIQIWRRQSKIQNNILKILYKILPQRIGIDLCSEKLGEKPYGDRVFCFPDGGFSIFWISWKRGQIWQRQFQERLDRDIQGQKFVKLLEKVT